MNLIIETLTESQEILFKNLASELNLICKSEEEMEDENLVRIMQSEPFESMSVDELKEYELYRQNILNS